MNVDQIIADPTRPHHIADNIADGRWRKLQTTTKTKTRYTSLTHCSAIVVWRFVTWEFPIQMSNIFSWGFQFPFHRWEMFHFFWVYNSIILTVLLWCKTLERIRLRRIRSFKTIPFKYVYISYTWEKKTSQPSSHNNNFRINKMEFYRLRSLGTGIQSLLRLR